MYGLNKRDTTEGEIIRALFAAGAYVVPMDRHAGFDLLVFHAGRVFVAEIKSPGGRMTENEKTRKFHVEEAGVYYYIWYTAEQALNDVIGVIA